MPHRDTAWPAGTPCWADLQVDDIARARAFYSGVFGWDILDSSEEYGGYLMAMKDGAPVCGIGPKMGDAGSMPSVWMTYFATDDAAATVAAGRAAGGRFFMDPMEVPGQGTMTVGTDPAGAAFGIWQAGGHTGFGIVNEPDTVVWSELHTPDYEGAQAFYAATFGHTFTEIGDGVDFAYSSVSTATNEGPGGDNGVAGIMRDPGGSQGGPPYWLTYFSVADPDATVAKAISLGATVIMEAEDTPYGRMAALLGPEGEAFSVMLPTPM